MPGERWEVTQGGGKLAPADRFLDTVDGRIVFLREPIASLR